MSSPTKARPLAYSEDEIAATCPVCRVKPGVPCKVVGAYERGTHYARALKSIDVMRWRNLGARQAG